MLVNSRVVFKMNPSDYYCFIINSDHKAQWSLKGCHYMHITVFSGSVNELGNQLFQVQLQYIYPRVNGILFCQCHSMDWIIRGPEIWKLELVQEHDQKNNRYESI